MIFSTTTSCPSVKCAVAASSGLSRIDLESPDSAGGPALTCTERKPPYRALRVGERGRIWVHRHTVAEQVEGEQAVDPNRPPPITWREPIVFDVFEPDGTYLGAVHLPPRTRAYVFRGDTVWGIRTGELDEQYVVRLAVSREGPRSE